MNNTGDYYSELAQAICWYKSTTNEFIDQAQDRITELEKKLPSGSGFDNGSNIDLERSTEQKIIIQVNFHHLDEHGYYDGWTYHHVVITPCLMYGYSLRVTGKDRNGIKEYIRDTFNNIIK